MKIIISGKHLDIGTALRAHVEKVVQEHVKKFFENAVTAHVTISKKNHLFATDMLVNEGTGNKVLIKSHAEDIDPYHSVDQATRLIDKQLQKYKSRLRNHNKAKLTALDIDIPATRYTLSPPNQEQINDPELNVPVIIAEKPMDIEKLSVSDAVMQLDLLQIPAVLFTNAQTNHLNMVYYRRDGNIAWVDIHTTKH